MTLSLGCRKTDLDPIVKTLREVFGANILRVPESRVQPLSVIATRDGQQSYEGTLGQLIPDYPKLDVDSSAMADISGKKTRNVDAGLGLQILSGFLSGLGIPGGEVAAHLSTAQTVSFSFGNVDRLYVNPIPIANALGGKILNVAAPAAAKYFADKPWNLLVVDSIIVSNAFTMHVDKTKDGSTKLDITAIQTAVGAVKADVTVSSASSLDVTFAGLQQLTFAFTCQRVFVSKDGRVTSVDPNNELLNAAIADGSIVYSPDRILVTPEADLVDIKFEGDTAAA
jgi:hypothetical protein